MKTLKFKKILVLILVICFLTGQTVFAQSTGTNSNEDNLKYLQSIMDMIKGLYPGEITDKELIEGALKGMFSTMDPYTVMFNPEEAKSFLGDIQGDFEGIGISMVESGQFIEVLKVFPSSPAEKAGMLPGDKLVEVDGKSLKGVSTDEAASLIKGQSGTKVSVTVMRGEKQSLIKFDIFRAAIKISPVTYTIKDGIGYIKLDTFNSNADQYISEALAKMDKAGIKKLVLDLRNNPGGLVDQAVAIARRFVPQGLITKLNYKSQPDEEYYSYLKETKYKLAVLVNGGSASASEILAGAIQDTKAGTLVGTRTFGKGKVQQIYPILTPEAQKKYSALLGITVVDIYTLYAHGLIPFSNEIAGTAKITVGQYSTPAGRMIDGKGIDPDIVVEDYQLTKSVDVNSITKLTKTVKPGLGSEGNDVYNAEKILTLLGYDLDQPDTRLDEKTFKAIDKFKRDNKLGSGGVLDFTTQQKLNTKLDELVLQIDTQYKAALDMLKK